MDGAREALSHHHQRNQSETMTDEVHVTWHEHHIDRPAREKLNGHRGCVVWFTGLSGCGKSTVANAVEHQLYQFGIHTFLLDGDNIRHGLNASPEILEPAYGQEFAARFGLTFAGSDREENIRRIGCVAELFCAAGIIALTAFVSPYRKDRDQVRATVNSAGTGQDFVEVFVDTPIEVCEARDPKGLYRKARAGEIKGFTGIDDPYEPPRDPEVHLDGSRSVEQLADEVLSFLRSIRKLDPPPAES